jgi:hypothetical protein
MLGSTLDRCPACRLSEAAGYMQAALRLLEHCPAMARDHRALMTEELRKATATLRQQGVPVGN